MNTPATNSKKPNAELVWKQLEDLLVPRLALSVIDRAVYSHLLRHSRLEGKLRLHFSIPWLARGVRLSNGATRDAVRRLVGNGSLRLVERTKAGHVVDVRLPAEVRAARTLSRTLRSRSFPQDIGEIDFLRTRALRKAIHTRERGLCFYCLRRLNDTLRCLDHVVPRVQFGRNSYRNLVSCCVECNSRKGETPGEHFLRWLYRERRLTAAELTARLRALDQLSAGKLRPIVAPQGNPPPRRGRPPLRG